MSNPAPDEPITAGLERLTAFQAAQRKVAEELAAERAERDAKQEPTVPAESSAPTGEGR